MKFITVNDLNDGLRIAIDITKIVGFMELENGTQINFFDGKSIIRIIAKDTFEQITTKIIAAGAFI